MKSEDKAESIFVVVSGACVITLIIAMALSGIMGKSLCDNCKQALKVAAEQGELEGVNKD